MSVWDDSGYDDNWSGGGGQSAAGPRMNNSAPDINETGANSDPFGYTNGSLLTPWTGKFDGSRFGGGGVSVPDFQKFNYGDFNYNASRPGGFAETYAGPGNFTYGEYSKPADFAGVTDKDMKADKGYKFRMDAGQKALTANKAAQGLLRTGGTAKALQAHAQDLASQEYGQVYGRKASEYDRNTEAGRFTYGTNRQNAAENFDRNVSNDRTGYQVRQAAWKDNAAVELDGSRHGYEVAQGTYDRNYQKARQGYDDEQQYRNAVASAGAANANQAYNRALDEYTRGRDEFWTNQDRQYAILDREANRGYDAATRYADGQAGLAVQRGDAQASGRVGSANAWNGALGTIGQNVSDAAMMYAYNHPPANRPPRPQGPPRPYSGGLEMPPGAHA